MTTEPKREREKLWQYLRSNSLWSNSWSKRGQFTCCQGNLIAHAQVKLTELRAELSDHLSIHISLFGLPGSKNGHSLPTKLFVPSNRHYGNNKPPMDTTGHQQWAPMDSHWSQLVRCPFTNFSVCHIVSINYMAVLAHLSLPLSY